MIKVNENTYKSKTKSGGMRYYTIRNCDNCGVEFFSKKYVNNPYCSRKCYLNDSGSNFIENISSFDMEVLNGSLLSDGCITKSKANKNYHFTHTCKHKEYVDFIKNNISISISDSRYRKNGKYGAYELRTPSSKTYNELRDIWYPDGYKIVPNSLKLTKNTILHWYLGDGFYSKRQGIILCTDSFNDNSLEILSNSLTDMGFINRVTSKNRISIPNKYVFEFINFLGYPPVECYNYKWDILPTESYFNRSCLFCGNKFNANQNHNKFCSNKCQKKQWKFNKNLKTIM